MDAVGNAGTTSVDTTAVSTIITQDNHKDNDTNEKVYSRQQQLHLHVPPYKASLLQEMSLATPASVIKQKRDSVSTVPVSESAIQDAQRSNITLSNPPIVHGTQLASTRDDLYNDNVNTDIADSLHHNLSTALSIKNSSDIFGQARTWAESLADESLLLGTSNPTYNHSTSTADESHFQPALNESDLEGSQSLATVISPGNSAAASGSVKFVNATMELLQNQMKREEGPKKKRTRTTSEQLRILQKAFNVDPMPSATARVALAKKLGMSPRAVQVWFQNRRAKGKLDQKRSEIVTNTSHATNTNVTICKTLSPNSNPQFIKGSASFMHPIQPSNQNHFHPLHPMLLGTTTSTPFLCHNMNVGDSGSQQNIFINIPHSIAPLYMGSRNQSTECTNSLESINSVNTGVSNMPVTSNYKHLGTKEKATAAIHNQPSNNLIDDQYTMGMNIGSSQPMISRLNLADSNSSLSNESVSHDSAMDRRNSVSYYHLDNGCFVPSQTYSVMTGTSVQHQSRHNGTNVMFAQPVGLGLEAINDTESASVINGSYHPQTYNMDHSMMMNSYMMHHPTNTCSYTNTTPNSYPPSFRYQQLDVSNNTNDSTDERCNIDNSLREGNRADHSNQRMFIQMADIVPPSVGSWQQLSTDTSTMNIATPSLGRSYSLPPQNGSMVMLGSSFNNQPMFFPAQMNQMMNVNNGSNMMNWPTQMMMTRSFPTFDSNSQFCYPTSTQITDQHIESKIKCSNTKKSNSSKNASQKSNAEPLDIYSTQILTPVSNITVTSPCTDVTSVSPSSFSTDGDRKKDKRSTSTPSVSPVDIAVGHLPDIPDESCQVINPSWDSTCMLSPVSQDIRDRVMTHGLSGTSFIKYTNQCQKSQGQSAAVTTHNAITPEELVTQRRMSRSSFSTLQPESPIDLNKYVQLDASLVLPIGMHDLMAEGLDLDTSNYSQGRA